MHVLGVILFYGREVRVVHCVSGSDSHGVIVDQHFTEKVESLFVHQVLVARRNELPPRLLCVSSEDVIVVAVESDVVLIAVGVEVISSKDFSDLDQLVLVVFSLEEGLLEEDHSSEHAAETPDVQRVVVGLQIDQEFRSLEVSGGHSHVVLLTGMVVFSETPVDESELPVGVVDHDIVRLDVSVHDSLAVAVVQGSQNFEDVVSDVEICEALVESSEIDISSVHVLHDKCGSFRHRVSHYVQQVYDVDSVLQCLEYLDLTSYLGLLDRFQDFYDNALVVKSIDSFVDFGVLSSANLLDDLVVVLGTRRVKENK